MTSACSDAITPLTYERDLIVGLEYCSAPLLISDCLGFAQSSQQHLETLQLQLDLKGELESLESRLNWANDG